VKFFLISLADYTRRDKFCRCTVGIYILINYVLIFAINALSYPWDDVRQKYINVIWHLPAASSAFPEFD